MDQTKPSCFVIQQFDEGGTYDKRYTETICPALVAAGVSPKRADQILGLQPIIEKIQQAIEDASICVAEVSTDNPNVWLELGYALSLNRPTVILCDKALRQKLPFDISHRPVIFYRTDSKSGYEELEEKIVINVKNELEKDSRILKARVLKEGVHSVEDLKDYEVAVLSTLLALWTTPNSGATNSDLQTKLTLLGFKEIAIGLGAASLLGKGYIQVKDHEEYDGYNSYETKLYQILPSGIKWLQNHEDKLELKNEPDVYDPDIPF
jgi:hypothetical protein